MSILDGPKIPWTKLKLDSPGALWQARVECHYALQVIGAVGHSFLAPVPSDSHTAARWLPELRAFMTGPMAKGGGRVALCAGDLEVLILSNELQVLDRKMALGMTSEALFAWVGASLKTHFGVDPSKLKARAYDLPERKAGPFKVDSPSALEQLSRYYDNAHSMLSRLSRTVKDAGEVLIWPHHMDMAVFVSIQEPSEPGGEDGRSLGLGMTPGDGGHQDPYFYILPWPKPDPSALPELKSQGTWQSEGWVGALLSLSPEFAKLSDDEQLQVVSDFFKDATPKARSLVEAAT